MRCKGSVTVTFSLVFMVMFSFILSFFEMAAYTARASYHASASLLAVENYFGAFLEPLYEEYHIFAREVPAGEDVVLWTGSEIAEDVAYMTEKKEGEKSLLLRSGADFQVTKAKVLTEDDLSGFYSQAVTAMKYRGALEVTDMLKEFAGMTEQANAHLEVAAAKAAADSAYGLVDEKILHLISLIDGVDIVKYEKFLDGKGVLFQKEAYVKYFCTSPQGAANYFDRSEVYQAFLGNYENPCDTLNDFIRRAEALADEMGMREDKELVCRNRLAETKGFLALAAAEAKRLEDDIKEEIKRQSELQSEIARLILFQGNEEEIEALLRQEAESAKGIEEMKLQKEQQEDSEKELKTRKTELEEEQVKLDKEREEQEKQLKKLRKEEKAFAERAEVVRDVCDEAYHYVSEIQTELKTAKKAKAAYEMVLDSVGGIIGEDAEKEYRDEMELYSFYEDTDGYDFNRMKQTLLENKSRLWNVKQTLTGTDIRSLRSAVQQWRTEEETIRSYSFEGLKLSYGEMSLAGDLYDGVESLISDEVAKGFLGFLTQQELSEKKLDTSYLPSGFRFKGEDFDVFSLLGTDMSGIFEKLQELLPEDIPIGTVAGGAADWVLFHSYLSAHFANYLEENKTGALSYEQEYLIAGKDTDRENLSSVAMRLVAIRTILHFISLSADSTRKAPAEQAALAACGIIGLPALKSLVVFLLLFVWALEEAMIDVAALLQGKRLLLYPGKNGGSLSFQEILSFSKKFVLEKAEKKANAKGAVFGYKEFLHLFLFMTPKEDKSYRALDLIQENLRECCGTKFRVNRCVWKISYRVDKKDYNYAYE